MTDDPTTPAAVASTEFGVAWRPREHPPLGLSAAGLVLRQVQTFDADELYETVAGSVDHLRPWMPWAGSYRRQDAVAFAAHSVARREAGLEFDYGIRERSDGPLLGVCSLMARIDPGALEIGYWVRVDRVRRGIASRAVAALTVSALSLADVGRVEIHHDVDNVASGGVPRALGYPCTGEVRRVPEAPAETGRLLVWTMESGQLPGRLAAELGDTGLGTADSDRRPPCRT